MTWHDTLQGLKQDLIEVRAQRQRRIEEAEAGLKKERDDLSLMSKNLGVEELLAEINATLLDGKGEIETIVGWESDEEEDLDLASGLKIIDVDPEGTEDDDEDTDVITTILSWDEGGDLEIAVALWIAIALRSRVRPRK